jgi:biotin synthase
MTKNLDAADTGSPGPRHDWTLAEVEALFDSPFVDLIFQAQQALRRHFDPHDIQLSTLLSIKTGQCPEDCKYCPQSVHAEVGLAPQALESVEHVVAAAQQAKAAGATRFCMGAAWRSPTNTDLGRVITMVSAVRDLGMETCVTLGMLTKSHAQRLADAGLDYYNHNLDTSPEYYQAIITTRTYQDRRDTLAHVRNAGIKVCCGGIVGMGESRRDRAGLLMELADLPQHPESVPINMLVPVDGTPLSGTDPIEPLEFVRTIAVARVMMPASRVRLSAGRANMSEEVQALCFLAGANSIFCGETLLTTPNPSHDADMQLLERLGFKAADRSSVSAAAAG